MPIKSLLNSPLLLSTNGNNTIEQNENENSDSEKSNDEEPEKQNEKDTNTNKKSGVTSSQQKIEKIV